MSEMFQPIHHPRTKREYFAGLAMQGMRAYAHPAHACSRDIAEQAVKDADALLAELEKQPMTTRGLDCNAWRRKRPIVAYVIACAVLAGIVACYLLTGDAARAVLAGAGVMGVCVPAGDFV